MALQHVISQLAHFGISASEELPNGGWCSSEEYLATRYGGVRRLIKVLERKITEGSTKAKLQLALVKNDPGLLVAQEESEPEVE